MIGELLPEEVEDKKYTQETKGNLFVIASANINRQERKRRPLEGDFKQPVFRYLPGPRPRPSGFLTPTLENTQLSA